MTADARREAETTARYLLGVADETRLGEFEEELVECIRALLASPPATPAHDPKPNCPDCYGLGLYLYGGTEAPRVCGCRPTEPAPALPEEENK